MALSFFEWHILYFRDAEKAVEESSLMEKSSPWHSLLSFVSKWGGFFSLLSLHFWIKLQHFFTFRCEFSFCLFRYFNYFWKELLDTKSWISLHKGWALPRHPASIHPDPLPAVGVFINAVQIKWKIPHYSKRLLFILKNFTVIRLLRTRV